MYNVSVNIPDEVLYDTHLSKNRSEEFVRRAAAMFYYTKLGVSLGYCANIAEMPKTASGAYRIHNVGESPRQYCSSIHLPAHPDHRL